ncbi:MAG: ATP-binding protein, partial [Bacteroidota bacterium]
AMDYRDLKKLVRQGENLHLEFKLKANHPKKIVKEAVAFANSEGGVLLIGVNDDREIRGLKYAEEDEFALTRALKKHCNPEIKYEYEKIPVERDRDVLVFYIPKSSKVHYYKEDEKSKLGRAYIRIEDRSMKASPEMRDILRGQKRRLSIKLNYGEKERILMQYLQANERITVDEFSKTANIPRRVASRTLVLLVLAKVLKVIPNTLYDTDSFEFREQSFS